MDPDTEALQAESERAALRKTEAEIRSLEVNTRIATGRFWLDVSKFVTIIVPLVAGAVKYFGAWLWNALKDRYSPCPWW